MEHYRNLDLEDIKYFCEIDLIWKVEQWKDLPNHKGVYMVSDLGRVKTLDRIITTVVGVNRFYKGKISKQTLCKVYLKVTLSKNLKYPSKNIHILVAITFLNHTPCGHLSIIDHINNNPLDNRLCNIQITTNRTNSSKDRKNKTSKYTGVWWNKESKKWQSGIILNKKRKHLGYFTNELEASNAYQSELKNESKINILEESN